MADQAGHKMWRGTHRVPYVSLLLLFAAAFAWRMQGVTQWPMPYHPMLQYENALNTQALWFKFKGNSATPEERAWLSGYQGRWKGLPVVECLTASVYRLTDREMPWVSGLFTSLIWMTATGFFYDLARRHLHSIAGAFAATCFLLLHTFTLVLNRSYQHETVVLLGFILAWWCIGRWDVVAGFKQSLFVGAFCGAALLFKPGVAWIPWCFVLLAESVYRHGWRKTLHSPWVYLVPFLTLIPSVLWMKFIMTTNETHQWKWFLLFSSAWYRDTCLQLMSVIGWLPVLLLLFVTLREAWRGNSREIILLMGCLCYLAVFNYACMTHDYYLLVFFPLTALAWGRLSKCYNTILRVKYPHKDASNYKEMNREWRRFSIQRTRSAALVTSALATFLLANLGFVWHRAGNDYSPYLSASPYRPQEQLCRSLGQQLGIGTHVIALTNDYAMPLRYFSGLHAQWWPKQLDLWYEGLPGGRVFGAAERLEQMLSKVKVRYFIVTLMDEWKAQPELQQLMQQYREVPINIEGVRVFDLEKRIP